MATRPFTLSAVLTVTTGRLLGDIDDLYEILNHMTSKNLYTHQLARAAEACRSALLDQFGFLRSKEMQAAEESLTEILMNVDRRCRELAKEFPAGPGYEEQRIELHSKANKAATGEWLISLTTGTYGLKLPCTFAVVPLEAFA